LTQAQLGLHLLAPDQSYLSQMEAGERNPTSRILFRIAEGLGITVGDLFQTEGVPEEIANAPNKAVPKTRAGRVKKLPATKQLKKRSKADATKR
jgi:transcriptional regulator with XRE-family HTH domain